MLPELRLPTAAEDTQQTHPGPSDWPCLAATYRVLDRCGLRRCRGELLLPKLPASPSEPPDSHWEKIKPSGSNLLVQIHSHPKIHVTMVLQTAAALKGLPPATRPGRMLCQQWRARSPAQQFLPNNPNTHSAWASSLCSLCHGCCHATFSNNEVPVTIPKHCVSPSTTRLQQGALAAPCPEGAALLIHRQHCPWGRKKRPTTSSSSPQGQPRPNREAQAVL